MPVVSQIFVYPVKSLSGFAVQYWPVERNGLMYDRKWMLIDEEHRFLSQRRLPKMALINTRIEAERLILSAPGLTDVSVPLASHDGETLRVEIWNDVCQAKSVAADVDQWLVDFLGVDCRLVYHPDDAVRQVDQRFAAIDDQTAFSDGFPFLLVAENSLQALNLELAQPVSMSRFRPNLVVSDCDAYAEDHWRRIAINGIEFRLPKPCSRCSVPNVDPETALCDKEPLATLSRLRKADNKVYFGQNALHDRSGHLAVGDRVDVLEIGAAQPTLNC